MKKSFITSGPDLMFATCTNRHTTGHYNIKDGLSYMYVNVVWFQREREKPR